MRADNSKLWLRLKKFKLPRSQNNNNNNAVDNDAIAVKAPVARDRQNNHASRPTVVVNMRPTNNPVQPTDRRAPNVTEETTGQPSVDPQGQRHDHYAHDIIAVTIALIAVYDNR